MTQSATIEKVSTVAKDTTEIIFNITKPFSFIAGQYVTVILPVLRDLPTKDQSHDFSICSAPEEDSVAIVFRNSDSAFKQELLQTDHVPEIMIEGPKGIFTLPDPYAASVAFVAGGVGISPFLSIIRHLRMEKSAIRPTLFYYNRDRESAPYLAELEGYADTIDLVSVFGMMTEKEVASYHATHADALWYLAGPRGMVQTAREILATINIDDRVIKSEEFAGYEY